MSDQDPDRTPGNVAIPDAANNDADRIPRNVANPDAVKNFVTHLTKVLGGNEIAEFIGTVALAEEMIGKIIATYLARNKVRAEYLLDNFVGRASNDKKITVLAYIIEQSGWDQEFSNAIVALREMVSLRNKLAHTYTDSMQLEKDDFIFQRAVRGSVTPVRLSVLMTKKTLFTETIAAQLADILNRVSADHDVEIGNQDEAAPDAEVPPTE